MFASTIIPTINRPTLSRAVRSVLDQTLPPGEFEVIVVNDSGQPLPEMDWQRSDRVRVLETNRMERSVARNAGAAVASGKYLHFLDDDDVMVEGALQAFLELDHRGEAQWLYGAYQSVDNAGNLLQEFKPEIGGDIFAWLVAGESIPLQASLIDRELFIDSGKFDPKFTTTEDHDMGRRLALRGTVASTCAVVAQIRVGEQGSSTAGRWHLKPEKDREGREKALSNPAARARLMASACTGYLHGRVSRAYFASMVWNMRHKNLLVALNRALSGILFAGHYILTPDYWRGLKTHVKRISPALSS